MFETQGGTRNRTRDLQKKASAFILSSDHWTLLIAVYSHYICYNVLVLVLWLNGPRSHALC